MKRKMLVKQLDYELKKYDLKKEERTIYFQQGFEVINSASDSELETIDDISEILDEVFELNDITPTLKKENKFSINKAIIGIDFIIIAILILTSMISFNKVFILFTFSFVLIALINRSLKGFIFSSILFLLALNSIFGLFNEISTFNLVIGIFILWIGVSIVFHNKYSSHRKYKKEEKYKQYYRHHSHHRQYRNRERFSLQEDSTSYIKEDIYVVNNLFGTNVVELNDEKVNMLDLENKFGSLQLNLSTFEFPLGDTTLDFDNSCGEIRLILNKEIRVINISSNVLGGIDMEENINTEFKNTVYLKGKNFMGGINIVYV